jgi:DNA-binding NtrC family response regulator
MDLNTLKGLAMQIYHERDDDESINDVFDRIERILIKAALIESLDNTQVAADKLGISRTCLFGKRTKHGLKIRPANGKGEL